MELLEFIKNYKLKNILPMHMPGHKGNEALAPYLKSLCAGCDMTEINDFDDLHAPCKILKECQQRAEDLWHSKHSYYLVNGSTCGILAGIRSCTKWGDTVLVARNCHKSVYNALELCGLKPVYMLPQMLDSMSVYSCITPTDVKQMLDKYKEIKLVIITSPTYEGIISDIKGIAEVAHSYGVPVLVDEAHGAHLDLSPYFTGGAVKGGADVVVQSLHKTLPSLTQTAVLHLNSQLVSTKSVQRQLSVFQTSSPSYLLMSSIDGCVKLLKDNPQLFKSWYNSLQYFKDLVQPLKKLSILNYNGSENDISDFDSSKIVISTVHTAINGKDLMDILRNNYKIELEMCSGDYAIAMTGMADTKKDLQCLAEALLNIDIAVDSAYRKNICTTVTKLPQQQLTLNKAEGLPVKNVKTEDSKGMICGEYVWIYPPGIPIITPGEVVNSQTISIIENAVTNNMNLQKTISEDNSLISVIAY